MGKLYASLLLPYVVIGLRVYTSFCCLCGIHHLLCTALPYHKISNWGVWA